MAYFSSSFSKSENYQYSKLEGDLDEIQNLDAFSLKTETRLLQKHGEALTGYIWILMIMPGHNI